MSDALYVAHVAKDGGMLVAVDLATLTGPLGRCVVEDLLRRAASLSAGCPDDWAPFGEGHFVAPIVDEALSESGH